LFAARCGLWNHKRTSKQQVPVYDYMVYVSIWVVKKTIFSALLWSRGDGNFTCLATKRKRIINVNSSPAGLPT
jgi:hypothetical protein